MKIYFENKKLIEQHNADYEAGKSSYTMGINQFADQVSDF